MLMLCACSCSVDRYLSPENKLLKKNSYQVEMATGEPTPKEIESALGNMRNYTVQKPNKRLLGTIRLKMRLYCLPSPSANNFLSRYLQREGEPPVVYDESSAIRTTQQLQSLLLSKGCFSSTVSFDTIELNDRDLEVVYKLKPSKRYQIDEVIFRAETPEVQQLLEEWSAESNIKVGDYYDQEKIAAERDRVTENLQNEGYYTATKDLVRFVVDTTYNEQTLSVAMTVRNPMVPNADGKLEATPMQKYRIDKIYLYPNGNLTPGEKMDTLVYTYDSRGRKTDYNFVYNQEISLKPKVIARNMFLFNGQTYRPRNLSRTYNSLLGLHNFRYIDIEVLESPKSNDSIRLLDTKIRLRNSKKQKFAASLELTNTSSFGSLESGLTSGDFGLEGVLSYQNKNLFGGAELLKMEGSLLMELPKLILREGIGDEFHNNVNAFEIGFDASLDIPNFILPFTKNILWQQTKPHTVFNIGTNYQYRYYFERVLANLSTGYSWTKSRQIQQQLLPIELTFVRFMDLDQGFLDRISGTSDPRLKYQYSDHFILDARYDFVYSNQTFNTRNDFTYFKFSLESAGNILQGISEIAGIQSDENGIRSILGVPYSQYVRFNSELKHYFYHGKKNTFVTRMLVGIGLPYTNSTAMPYEKSFYGGGPTTMRAWQLRYLGPGTFSTDEKQMFERVGDMSLVVNLEERFPIVGIFEGAVFADIGNVWLMHKSDEWVGGEFNLKEFPQSIAVGTGLGLRLNISILTLRADFGIPLYDPGYDEGHRFRIPYWKPKQIVTNIGIDYPF